MPSDDSRLLETPENASLNPFYAFRIVLSMSRVAPSRGSLSVQPGRSQRKATVTWWYNEPRLQWMLIFES